MTGRPWRGLMLAVLVGLAVYLAVVVCVLRLVAG